ncbi:MAG: hypothetical protein LBN33_07555 [Desulfovibrio sp.]|jgi:hypothetical protein|nr:hypothetical protein [Desulfovibrio sp.]
MTLKKKIALSVSALLLIGIGITAGQYYFYNIKLPDISPRQVVEQYFAAVKEGDYKKAYAFVSLKYYHESYNQFIDRVVMYSPEMRLEVTKESMEDDKAVVDASVVVPLQFGSYTADSRMDLVRDKREWKIIHP